MNHEALLPYPRYQPYFPNSSVPNFCLAGLVGFTLADGIGHSHRNGRRGGRAFRRGRQEAAPAAGGYEAAPPLDSYGRDSLDQYASGSELDARSAELDALSANIPGIPGEDYPIFAEVPESSFTCDGQVDGGNPFFIGY